jgi:hypothetical protein
MQDRIYRPDGYYWVKHDNVWFVAYFYSSENQFFFTGQTIGFDPEEFEEIDDQRIVRFGSQSTI